MEKDLTGSFDATGKLVISLRPESLLAVMEHPDYGPKITNTLAQQFAKRHLKGLWTDALKEEIERVKQEIKADVYTVKQTISHEMHGFITETGIFNIERPYGSKLVRFVLHEQGRAAVRAAAESVVRDFIREEVAKVVQDYTASDDFKDALNTHIEKTLYKGIVDEVQQRTAKAITDALSKPTTKTGEPHA